jgi:hypothetical protein
MNHRLILSRCKKAKTGLGLLWGMYQASAEIGEIEGAAIRVTKAVFQVCC